MGLFAMALLALGLLVAAVSGPAAAQVILKPNPPGTSSADYRPMPGQAGKDVVWVPSPQSLVDNMLDMARMTKDDIVVDLGSGDGRTVITAAQRGTRARGVEFNNDLVLLSRRNAAAAGVSELASFEQGDIFETDFSDATLVTLFLLPELNLKLRPILLDMKPGTRVVSNSFDMGEWRSDNSIGGDETCRSWCRAYLWIVPAKAEGDWQLGEERLVLRQTFQNLDGSLVRGADERPISAATLRGTAISFVVDGRQYHGEVGDEVMSGKVDGGADWSARRLSRRASR